MFVEGIGESLEGVRGRMADAALKNKELGVRSAPPADLQWRYLEPVLVAGMKPP